MKIIVCQSCKEELLYADNGGKEEIVKFQTVCPCGKVNTDSFIGYPKLTGNDKYYFEFVDEAKIVCKPRISYKRSTK